MDAEVVETRVERVGTLKDTFVELVGSKL
jgi:hypothetical protein